MRRVLVAAAGGLALVVALVACAGLPGRRPAAPEAGAASSRLRAILERRELRVATSADLPPLAMHDRDGRVTGFEIDLVKALAAAMDLEVRIVERPFPDLLPTLQRGDADLVISGLTMTPERNARVAFAGPYFVSGTSLVTRGPEPPAMRDLAALDDPERSFAALADSTSAAFVRKTFPRARLLLTRSYDEAIGKLRAGEVDAVAADYLRCRLAEWRYAGEGLRALRPPLTTEPLGIALPADDPLLLNLVENYLKTLEDTGELTALKARWLSDGSWLEKLP